MAAIEMPHDVPSLIDSDLSAKEFRRNWARLIQKVYEVGPLIYPKCQGEMRVISVIEHQEIIKKILQHLGLWEIKARPPSKTNICLSVEDLPEEALTISDDRQMPSSHDYDDYLIDPVYPV
jgi:hypothetical protein